MPETRSVIEELDLWSDAKVIGPLAVAQLNQRDWAPAAERVKKAIRQKVVESYHKGQAHAGLKISQPPPSRIRKIAVVVLVGLAGFLAALIANTMRLGR